MRDKARGAFVILWLGVGCDLGRVDVVTRSPDLGPAVSIPSGSDAREALGGDAGMDADVGILPADGADGRSDRIDVSQALDGRDTLGERRGEVLPANPDAVCAGEAGGECGTTAWVMTDDFEDGAAGWMSTGIIWTVTGDTTSPQGNAVLAPTGPAASSVYYSYGDWQDMTAEVRLRVTAFGKASSANRAELYARYQDAGHFYALALRSDQRLILRSNASSLGSPAVVSVAEGEWHVLKIRVSGPAEAVAIEGYLDGVLLLAATDTEEALPSARGTVGVGIYGETVAVFDDVRVSTP